MFEWKSLRTFGCFSALLASGAFSMACSGANPNESGPAPQVEDHGVGTEMIIPPSTINVIPATPIPQNCAVETTNGTYYLPAHYVEKIPNSWGAPYYNPSYSWTQRFQDGYSVPFPTPWITQTSSTPDPFTYEHQLYAIPSTLWWEYLVHDIQPPPPGSRTYTEDLSHAYFMVGIPALSDYDAALNLANSNSNSLKPVEARINKCVRILTRSGSYIYDTGERFFVYDEHDPMNPPN